MNPGLATKVVSGSYMEDRALMRSSYEYDQAGAALVKRIWEGTEGASEASVAAVLDQKAKRRQSVPVSVAEVGNTPGPGRVWGRQGCAPLTSAFAVGKVEMKTRKKDGYFYYSLRGSGRRIGFFATKEACNRAAAKAIDNQLYVGYDRVNLGQFFPKGTPEELIPAGFREDELVRKTQGVTPRYVEGKDGTAVRNYIWVQSEDTRRNSASIGLLQLASRRGFGPF